MSQHWIFHEPGSIPGIPGTFANCRVLVDENGKVEVLPPVLSVVEAPGTFALTEEDKPAEDVPPAEQSSEVVKEQAQQPAPFFKEG